MAQSDSDAPTRISLPCTEEILSYNFQYEDDVSEAIECPSVVHHTLPEGFEIRKARHGVGLFATKFFPKNACLFTTSYIPIHDKYAKTKLTTDHGDVVELDTVTHFLNPGNGTCLLDPIGGLVNHSCSSNAYNSDDIVGLKVTRKCPFYALRDIQPNEEITNNYCLGAYDVPGDTIPIDPCDCGSENCYGSMRGFKNLPEDEKQRLLPYTLLNVRMAYFMDKKKKVNEKLNQQ